MKVSYDYSIYIKFGSKKVRIPVNPEELKIEYPTDHETHNVLGKGEIIVPRRPSLKIASWESFFPGSPLESYVNQGAMEPKDYEKYFSKALRTKQKCRLIITRSGSYDTNLRCVVSKFETADQGGEPGDIYYSVELTEYRDYEPEVVAIVTEITPTAVEPAAAAQQERPVETPVLRVGATVTANGKYWSDSYGGKPFGIANNLSTTVTRIVSGTPYPVHVGAYGWMQEKQLQITE